MIQLIGPHEASVSCAVAELLAAIEQDELPVEAAAVFGGFGRPDGRGWLGFHDGVSNLESSRRPAAIVSRGDPAWLAGGTTMALLRFAIDLVTWRGLTRTEQELLVGRDRDTGAPLARLDAEGVPVSRPSQDPETDRRAFVDPPETTDPAIERSHIHRANQSRAWPGAPAALRIFRQGYWCPRIAPAGGPPTRSPPGSPKRSSRTASAHASSSPRRTGGRAPRYLGTDKPENVRLYERFGFETIGQEPVIGVPN